MKASREFVRTIVVAFVVASAVLALGPVDAAMAEAPVLTIDSPLAGSSTNNPLPLFAGTTDDALDQVTLDIYAGTAVEGTPLTLTTLPLPLEGTWSLTPPSPLADGTYTAVATQTNLVLETGTSEPPVTFTVDTTAPVVSLAAVSSPTNDSTPSFSGGAGVAVGDDPVVRLKVYSGGSAFGSAVRTVEVAPTGGSWSAGPVAALPDGVYTAQAEQEDLAGNTGVSSARTFTVDTTPPVVSITTPANGAFLKSSKPTFSGNAGNASGDDPSVTLNIYTGTSASGPHQTISISRNGTSSWTESNGPQLADGTYTAQVEQEDLAGNVGVSSPHTFTIKTNSPVVTLNTAGWAHRGAKLVTGNATPSFDGAAATAPEDIASVTLKIYAGESASGGAIRTLGVTPAGAAWSAGPVEALPDGTYTAQVEQEDLAGNVGVSSAFIFTVDTTPPQITLTSPADGSSTVGESQLVKGAAGTAEGDLPGVTAQLYSGSSIGVQAPLESIMVDASGGAWSATFGGLGAGVYTVRAEQSDDLGNLGMSSTRTFSITSPVPVTDPTPPAGPAPDAGPASAPPVASFAWFPTAPHTGEPVSLASSSTDAVSPIVALAWDLDGNGTFAGGGPVIGTSFSTPGSHIVRLRVTDANGLSSVAAETIEVTPPPVALMQPFPIVRIVGSDTSTGVRLSLLTVQAPAGARITVRCRGRGCPAKSESQIAASSNGRGTVLIAFRRFERSLLAGALLEIRVSKSGEIGKYTSFAIHRGKPPVRVDECLAQTHPRPIVCPPS